MKKIRVLIPLILFSVPTFSQPIIELDSAEYFDFWVGEWSASWDEGDGVVELGTNTITKSLDDKVIIENFRITDGKNKGFKGMSMTVFQPRVNRWKQSWTDNQGGYYDFVGHFDKDKRIFKTAVTQKNNKQIQQRMVFHEVKMNSMIWDWELSVDGGESWALQWRIFYKKKVE